MGRPGLRLLHDTENDLQELSVKRCGKKATAEKNGQLSYRKPRLLKDCTAEKEMSEWVCK